jgi:hypothetical protein
MGKSSKRKPMAASELAATVYARNAELPKTRTKSSTHHRKAMQGVLAEFQQVVPAFHN